ncbi:MAG: type IV pilus modification protein PilV [Gammaproteobacteria bacterium]|jgi:type IV pilus assembly protein PilV|nr:type IV pilus modification protein PilV [Gammaproteobacteria bacterium]MDH3751159.1 type IV pilus modification protein PilV [Gammaproteobacteria bacterium]MDH3804865.1 type IV pilus modification protein PilV [Gammaproteobacteria bacterium]
MFRYHHQERGFSLIELLVTVVVFSVGLLAVAGLQTVSKQANFEAIQRTSASQVANGLLENIRVNANAADIYLAAGQLGNGSRGAEPAPNCRGGAECNAAQKAAHDLWFWEQVIDGNLETNAGAGTGGMVLPTLCLTGPVGAGAGVYQVSIAWRGTASFNNAVNNPCGAASGSYGAGNEFRRIIQIPTFIDPNI